MPNARPPPEEFVLISTKTTLRLIYINTHTNHRG
jgi:hypothetical protein